MFTTQRGDPLLQILGLLTRSIDLHAGALLDSVNMLSSGGALGAGRRFLRVGRESLRTGPNAT